RNAAAGYVFNEYTGYFIVDDGVVPVFFRQHDALGGLWNGWQSQCGEYKALSLTTGYTSRGLNSTVSLSLVQIVNGMKIEHKVRYACIQPTKDGEKNRGVERLRCPACKDKVVGHIGFGGIEVFPFEGGHEGFDDVFCCAHVILLLCRLVLTVFSIE